jgi:ABC-type dipeptide/oligopeptide/nickel transport system permease subunit
VADPPPRSAEIARPRKWRGRTSVVWRLFVGNAGAVAGTVVLLAWVAGALAAPRLAPYDPLAISGVGRQAPSLAHPAGTDLLGRDVLSRVIFGARISLAIGLISVAIGVAAGAFMGIVAGYYGGNLDFVLMRVVDAMLAFPGLLLALMVIAALGPGLVNVMLAVGISSIPLYARLVRGSCLSIRTIEYVQAARAMGGSDGRVMYRHILPNVFGPIVVLSTLQIGSAILIGSALSYLGMGAQPPAPEWGLMTSEGQAYLANAWWISTCPGFAIFSAVIAINLMGDGLRAALDPRSTYR